MENTLYNERQEKIVMALKKLATTKPGFCKKENEKKQILIIPASIRSHIVPSLFLAKILSKEFEIQYAVTNQILADIVTKNGYLHVMNDHFRIGVGMERSYVKSKTRKTNFWKIITCIYNNDIYRHRKKCISEIIKRVKPDVVIIDIFSSTDFLPVNELYPEINILLFNPMLSTYKVEGYPTVSDSTWFNSSSTIVKHKHHNILNLIKDPKAYIENWLMRQQWNKLSKIAKLPKEHSIVDTTYTKLFNNIPEILLAPEELEFSSKIRKSNQYYLGLCIDESRIDIEIDPKFENKWCKISSLIDSETKLIYCSFGTFYSGPDHDLLVFINTLVKAVETIKNVEVICSVNDLIIETIQQACVVKKNMHFFSRVPQIKVLKKASLHITHGGLGSIKESINSEVPMLVYPLDLQYDQNGNGLKVEYHKIGLRGVLKWENVESMKEKIEQILLDENYKINIKNFKYKCEN